MESDLSDLKKRIEKENSSKATDVATGMAQLTANYKQRQLK